MASSGKRKTTGAKLAREGKLRERRAAKQAKKDARRASPVDYTAVEDDASTVEYEARADQAPAQLAPLTRRGRTES